MIEVHMEDFNESPNITFGSFICWRAIAPSDRILDLVKTSSRAFDNGCIDLELKEGEMMKNA
jgi:hypothetical protein